ncbi:hypothetical protein LTR08_004860 [Meristemomyces frigidus]|nr:hypothetical protein LTR08_004860 [Meristemomyces frigidus]
MSQHLAQRFSPHASAVVKLQSTGGVHSVLNTALASQIQILTDISFQGLPGGQPSYGAPALPGVCIKLNPFRGMLVTMQNDQDSFSAGCEVQLYIPYNDQSLALAKRDNSQGLQELIADLSSMSYHVIKRVLNGMVFERFETVSNYLSEALLRVFDRDTRVDAMTSVKVVVRLSDTKAPLVTSDAFWKPEFVGSTSTANSPTAQRVRIENTELRAPTKERCDAGRILDKDNAPAPVAPSQAPKGESEGEKDLDGDSTLAPVAPIQGGVFIAFGSNMGDRLDAIEAACRAIDADDDMRIVQSSCMYETKPMYVEDQASFLNAVCEIDTELEPLVLLDRLQAIEKQLGRVKIIEKGPRSIDLDILLYKGQSFHDDRLTIPHALMTKRAFVMVPLMDVCGWKVKHLGHHLDRLNASSKYSSRQDMYPQVSLGAGCALLQPTDPHKTTQVMSILNVTPDSFSDGGVNAPTEPEALKATVARDIAEGATIIDIGGQSSKPNAQDITAEEEIARILPAIGAIKSLPESAGVAISIDTYRAAVAEAAVKAGAHIVNDISAGVLDPEMLPTVARLGCTFIMMHMRGTPATMQSKEHCSYPKGLVRTVNHELGARVRAAQAAGIRRWRIILDPGIGFAKTQEQNLCILKGSKMATVSKYPQLIGTSRKSFIGKITDVEVAKERLFGTAAAVTAAVRARYDVVRVHDVREMAQVVKMADAIYRGNAADGPPSQGGTQVDVDS